MSAITLPEDIIRKVCVGYANETHGAKLFEFRDWNRAEVTVEWRGEGLWAVLSYGFRLDKNIELDYEPLSSSLTD